MTQINVFSAPCGAGKTQNEIIPRALDAYNKRKVVIVTCNTKILADQTTNDLIAAIKKTNQQAKPRVVKINGSTLNGFDSVGEQVIAEYNRAIGDVLGTILVVTLKGYSKAFANNSNLLNDNRLACVLVDELDDLITYNCKTFLVDSLTKVGETSDFKINGKQYTIDAGKALYDEAKVHAAANTTTNATCLEFEVQNFKPTDEDYVGRADVKSFFNSSSKNFAVTALTSDRDKNNQPIIPSITVVGYAVSELVQLLQHAKTTVFTAAPELTDLEFCKSLRLLDYKIVGTLNFNGNGRTINHTYVFPDDTGGKTKLAKPEVLSEVLSNIRREFSKYGKILVLINAQRSQGERERDGKINRQLSDDVLTVFEGKMRGVNDYRDYRVVVVLQRFEPNNQSIKGWMQLLRANADQESLFRSIKNLQECYQGTKRVNVRDQNATGETYMVHLNEQFAQDATKLYAKENFNNSTLQRLQTKSVTINAAKKSGGQVKTCEVVERKKCSAWINDVKKTKAVKSLQVNTTEWWDAVVKAVLQRNAKEQTPFDEAVIKKIMEDRKPKGI